MEILSLEQFGTEAEYYKKVLDLTYNKKVVLSDVFDTVLVRTRNGKFVDYYEPSRMIEEYLPKEPDSYVKYRRDAGHAAREGYNGAYYGLDNIVTYMPLWCSRLVYFEELFDAKLLHTSLFGKVLISAVQNTDKEKYFLTDTYYGKDTVQNFLDANYAYTDLLDWQLLCSSTDKIAKSDGTMYDIVRETHSNLSSDAFIMFSDRVEDLEMAAKYQITGILVKPEMDI